MELFNVSESGINLRQIFEKYHLPIASFSRRASKNQVYHTSLLSFWSIVYWDLFCNTDRNCCLSRRHHAYHQSITVVLITKYCSQPAINASSGYLRARLVRLHYYQRSMDDLRGLHRQKRANRRGTTCHHNAIEVERQCLYPKADYLFRA